jgi:MscS family membrane protein
MALITAVTHPAAMAAFWIIGGIILAVASIIIINILETLAERKKLETTAALIAELRVLLAAAFVLAGIYGGVIWLGVQQKWVYIFLKTIIIGVSAYCVISVSTTLIKKWLVRIVRKTPTRSDDNFLSLFQGFFKLAILLLAFALILSNWGIHITALIAGLGIAGLAVGLALQGTMANILGGLALILDDTFNVGDTIHLDTGETGEIIHVGLRSTKILTDDAQLIIMPNSALANAKITNFSLPNPHLRIVIDVNVAYGSDANKVRKILLGSLKGVHGVMSEPAPLVHFKELGESSINFQLKFFIEDYRNRGDLRSEVLQRVYENLQLAGIDIPFPTRTLYMKK